MHKIEISVEEYTRLQIVVDSAFKLMVEASALAREGLMPFHIDIRALASALNNAVDEYRQEGFPYKL